MIRLRKKNPLLFYDSVSVSLKTILSLQEKMLKFVATCKYFICVNENFVNSMAPKQWHKCVRYWGAKWQRALEHLDFKFWVKAPIVPLNYVHVGKSLTFQFMHYINIYKKAPFVYSENFIQLKTKQKFPTPLNEVNCLNQSAFSSLKKSKSRFW